MLNSPFELLNRHVNVSHETFERLNSYFDLLAKWQSKINLVSSDSLSKGWERHFLDSLQLLNITDFSNKIVVDFGSGAGFPGMVLAIASNATVHLIESDGKKVAFLSEVARLTRTDVKIHQKRIEELDPFPVNIITARAVTSLDELLQYSHPLVSHETICLFHKGKNYSKEIKDASLKWYFKSTITPSVTDNEGVILQLSDIRQTHDTDISHRKPEGWSG